MEGPYRRNIEILARWVRRDDEVFAGRKGIPTGELMSSIPGVLGSFKRDQMRCLPADTVAFRAEVIAQFPEDGLSCKIYIFSQRNWHIELGVIWLRRRAGYEGPVRMWLCVPEKRLPPELQCSVS